MGHKIVVNTWIVSLIPKNLLFFLNSSPQRILILYGEKFFLLFVKCKRLKTEVNIRSFGAWSMMGCKNTPRHAFRAPIEKPRQKMYRIPLRRSDCKQWCYSTGKTTGNNFFLRRFTIWQQARRCRGVMVSMLGSRSRGLHLGPG